MLLGWTDSGVSLMVNLAVAGHAASSAESQIHEAHPVDGTLERVPEHGAGEAVDDGVQGAVQVGEADRQAEELGQCLVALAVVWPGLLVNDRQQAGKHAGCKAHKEHRHDDPHSPDGTLHLALSVHVALAQAAGNAGGTEDEQKQRQHKLQHKQEIMQPDAQRWFGIRVEAAAQ